MIRPATVLIWVLALTPVIVALINLAGIPWQSAPVALTALGRLTGVGGLSFLLVAAILSSRVPGFDRYFGGLTKLWKTHHRLAAVSFLLLMLHPLLLALAASAGSPGVAVAVLFSADNGDVWLGWAALIVMMIFLAPSFAFFGEPKYQRWKLLHRLAGVAVILALAHAFLLARAIPHPWDYLVWFSLAALAVGAVAYRFLFSRAQLPGVGGRYHYRVAEVNRVTSNVVELTLQADSRALSYHTGQFIYLTACDKHLSAGYREEHPYTLSSSPTETNLRVAIKELGDASRAMQSVPPGSEARVEGPYGRFFDSDYDEDSELWIAGGIGISPFLSRARYMRETASAVDVSLIYCVQDEARAVFADELQEIARALEGFAFHLHFFYREGPLSLEFIEAHCLYLKNRGAYICGPDALLSLARRHLLKAGVPAQRIQTEEFNLL